MRPAYHQLMGVERDAVQGEEGVWERVAPPEQPGGSGADEPLGGGGMESRAQGEQHAARSGALCGEARRLCVAQGFFRGPSPCFRLHVQRR